jgi:hypothetical protein
VVTALAIIGATTGVVALAAQVWQFVLSGPRIKVTVAIAFLTNDDRWWLSIDLSNVGRLPVTIVDVGIVVERRGQTPQSKTLVGRVNEQLAQKPGTLPIAAMSHQYWTGPPLPHRLIDGEAATYLVLPVVVASGLADAQARPDVKGYARLATDKRIRSRKRIDVMHLATLDQDR